MAGVATLITGKVRPTLMTVILGNAARQPTGWLGALHVMCEKRSFGSHAIRYAMGTRKGNDHLEVGTGVRRDTA